MELAEARPDDPDVLDGLSQTFNNIGVAIGLGANAGQALAFYQRAVEFDLESLRLRPNDTRLAKGLGNISSNVAGVLAVLERKDEAIAERRKLSETLHTMAKENPEAPAIQFRVPEGEPGFCGRAPVAGQAGGGVARPARAGRGVRPELPQDGRQPR